MAESNLNLAGVAMRNRVLVAAGCHGADGDIIIETAKTGVAAITTKTIVAQAVEDVRPCFSKVEGGFLNCVFGTTLAPEQWFEVELPRATEAGIPIIASVAGLSPEEAADLAARAVAAGATMIEMPTVCPHMGEILEAMFPGLTMPPPEVHDVTPYVANIQAVKAAVDVPIIAKFSALFHANVVEWAVASEKAGVDAIACADAFGPVLKIDVETGEPTLGGPRGVGGLTGPALKPIALRMILEMAQHVSIPLIGVIVDGIDRWVQGHGYKDVGEIVGLTLRRIESRRERGLVAITAPQVPLVDEDLCIGCGDCGVICVYDAIHVGDDGFAVPDPVRCYGCGACRDVCPVGAIRFAYFDA
jgi:dihydroorotate dehydrogenase (NAD+) catalytic subunit